MRAVCDCAELNVMIKRVLPPLLVVLFFLPALLQAQDFSNNFEEYQYHIKKARGDIRIDGVVDEADWAEAQTAGNFRRVLPIDTGYSDTKSEVKVTYDDQNLYFVFINYEELPKPYIVESMRRDWSFSNNDNFLIFIDPFNDKTNGFAFGSNAAGAQWDGLQENGGAVNLNWDNAWISKTVEYEDRWVTEMAIPFKILRYRRDIPRWGVNFSRLDVKRNEKSAWAPVPRQFPTASLAFTGSLVWDQPPPETGTNVSLIPYALASTYKDNETNADPKNRLDAGLDAKIALSSSINLDLTINPDFSQVEVDRQVLNLSRFEIYYPERRQFFLENSDLFSGYGNERIRPFFSRRIGLESPIYGGARVSGKINKDWRAGLLNMQTGRVDSTNTPSANYTVATVQRQLFTRSNISAIFVNKQNFGLTGEDTLAGRNEYNRVAGLDYNLASENNKWQGKVVYHQSFDDGIKGKAFAHATNLAYKSQIMTLAWNHEIIGANYNPEVGYTPRKDYYSFYPEFAYRFYTESDKINYHGPKADARFIYNMQNQLTDKTLSLDYMLLLLNTSSFQVGARQSMVVLDRDFDPTRTGAGGDSLKLGSEHQWTQYDLVYTSDKRKLFTFFSRLYAGGFFNGQSKGFNVNMQYRYQPYGSIALAATYNDIDLPDPYNDAQLWLIGPKIDLTLTDKVFFSTFIQYNNQANNFNINSRFQWRFKPVSDLFIVYSDNYYAETFTEKNRALVVKLSYWLNM